MGDRLATAGVTNVDIVLVVFAGAEEVDEYQRRRRLPFPILVDADRATYASYGLARGSFFAVWGPATIRKYASILRKSGVRRSLADIRSATADTRQLGGDFVVAPDGRLTWGFWSTGPADRPSADEVLAAVLAAEGAR